ncbi:putative dihydroflavonol 4-reductase [Plesiocystis pacifica SIR-1]|uniref:Putative dihydroflavonol 4-reductase n=1 Tax=Plesiocystis pacifica SIR-1 TaxID=391625 RepID=A6G327_9BACT|nr:NAD-dependent epimerase/dehydratase family protein [Plesiocystis pacifica]EDM79652.1 putative dihydroflavonol 4-reductase [Plesiocystis pacifica SIR-1]
MTVVVTGASGHLGANLVRALVAEGQAVRAVVHRSSAALAELEGKIELAHGSVTELDSLRSAFAGARRVYHLAGVISIDGDRGGLVYDVNVAGTANVVQACLDRAVERLVHASSVHAYDQEPLDAVLDEARPQIGDSPGHPAYDRSKALGEREVLRGVEAGLDAVIVNPSGILGPHDYGPSRLGEVVRDLARGRLPAVLDGGFDCVDARDLCASLIAAADLERGRKGERYIVGGAWYSLHEIARTVEAVGGRRAPRLVLPPWVALAGVPAVKAWARLTRTEPKITRESIEVLQANRSISSAKARAELGHRNRPLAETVADTLAWFRTQG